MPAEYACGYLKTAGVSVCAACAMMILCSRHADAFILQDYAHVPSLLFVRDINVSSASGFFLTLSILCVQLRLHPVLRPALFS
jgi:hypothetical protein